MMADMQATERSLPPEKQTILLVDDNPTNLGVLFETLNESGFRLLVAEDGEAALEQIPYARPDIVLLDIMMPRMNGFETCRLLKANPATRDIPVIFMTALDDTVDKVKGLSIGGVDYITKPIQPDEVLARVRVHLKLQALHQKLKRQNQLLQAEVQERKRVERSLRLMIRAVSHDLRNPVTGMLMVLNNMLNGGRAGDSQGDGSTLEKTASETITIARSVLQRMAESAERQLNLINSLLEVHNSDGDGDGHGRADALILHRKALQFHRLVESVIQDLKPMLDEKRATLSCHLPADLPSVWGDANQLWRVLENLLSNAVKHNPPGVQIRVATELEGDRLRCSIHDNGGGIPAEVQGTLFEAYQRGHANRHTPGLGLGLYLCRQIIQAHGGEVNLKSNPEAGTTFWFTLPTVKSGVPREI